MRRLFRFGFLKAEIQPDDVGIKAVKQNTKYNNNMNALNKIGSLFLKVLAAAAIVIAMGNVEAHAANIKMHVRVPGYSTAGWILILPGSSYGGKVVYNSTYGCYVTDRAARGEQIRLTITPSNSTERCVRGAWLEIFSNSYPYTFWTFGAISIPATYTTTVTRDPLADNIYACVYTNLRLQPFEQRIPIGTR